MLNILIEIMVAKDVRGAITDNQLSLTLTFLGLFFVFEECLYFLNSFFSSYISLDHCASLNRCYLEKVNTDQASLIDYISAHLPESFCDDL